MKKIKVFLLIYILALIFIGCSPVTNTASTITTSFSNYNITFYKDISLARYIEFELISDQCLDAANIVIDIETPYSYTIDQNKIGEMPYYVFLNYKDLDWDKVLELDLKARPDQTGIIDRDAAEELSSYMEKHRSEYEDVAKKKNNWFYYSVVINFDMPSDISHNESFEELTLSVDEEKHVFNVGHVLLDYETELDVNYNHFNAQILGGWDKAIIPNVDGQLSFDDPRFTVTEDLDIVGFRLLSPDVTIEEISLIINDGNYVRDQLYNNGDRLSCKKGVEISLRVQLADTNLVNNQLYSTYLHLIVDYEIEGQIQSAYFESMYRTRPGFHELFAIKVDNVDFLPYYYNFLNIRDGD